MNKIDGFSIVVPTRLTSKSLKMFLKTLKEHSHFKHEIIIVCDIFTSWQVYKFLQENNIFYYQANLCNWYALLNFGAKLATRKYLVLSMTQNKINAPLKPVLSKS